MQTNLLDDYPVQVEIPVVWGDMDAFQHVNNLVYLKHFESVRMEYLQRCNYREIMQTTGIGPILRDTNCRYRIPLTFPDRVISATRTTQIQSDRFKMHHIIYSLEQQAVAAEGEAMIVCVDYQNNAIAEMPGCLKEAVLALEHRLPEITL